MSIREKIDALLEARGAGKSQVVSVMKELLRKHWSEYDLPVPDVKLVNNAKARWLARCKWLRGASNTTMEVQRMAMGDPNTLRRVLAHEMIHHWDFLTQHYTPGKNAHGAQFKQQASRINMMEGPDYVTVKSDESYDTSRVPPFYILITPWKGRFVWNIALRPSKKQKEIIVKRMAQYQSRLFKSTDGRLFHGAEKINSRSFSSSPDPEIKQAVEDLYREGKVVQV